jgi:hypothetical protein
VSWVGRGMFTLVVVALSDSVKETANSSSGGSLKISGSPPKNKGVGVARRSSAPANNTCSVVVLHD